MELQGNENAETESNDVSDEEHLTQELMDESDWHDYNSSDSDRDLLLPDAFSQNLSCNPRELGYMELLTESQELGDKEHSKDPIDTTSFNFDHTNLGDKNVTQNSKEFRDENVSHKPQDISKSNLFNNPNGIGDDNLNHSQNKTSDEIVEPNYKGIIGQNFVHDAKGPICNEDTYSQDPCHLTFESTFQESTEPKVQEISFECKVKNIREKFKRIPLTIIRNILQRDDVKEDLNAAITCLEAISASDGASRKGRQFGTNKVKKQKPPPVMPKQPPVMPKQPRKTVNSGERQSAHINESKEIKLQNEKKQEVSKSTLPSQSHHDELKTKQYITVSDLSFPEEMHGTEISCTFELGGNNFERNMILVKGLNKATSDETIINFAESKTKEQVLKIEKLDDETSALIQFETSIDFKNAKEKMERSSLEGVNVTVHRVPANSSILVRNLASNTTRDALAYYFSNPRIGGEVTCIQYEEGNEEAIVTFKDSDAMKKVLRLKSPKLNDAALLVECYNPFNQEATWEKQPQHKISVDKHIMEFISATESLSELKDLLGVQGFTMKYTSGDSFVYVTSKRARDISLNRKRGIKTVSDFTKKFRVIELNVDKNHWDAVTTEISKQCTEIGKDKLLVKECAPLKDKITIICRESDAIELKNMFINKIAETQKLQDMNAHERHTMDIEKEKLRLLKLTGYEKKLVSEYFDLRLDVEEATGKVTIAGPKQYCYEAKLQIYQEISKFCEKQILLSKSIVQKIDIKEVIERMDREFKLLWRMKQTLAIFHINGDTIFVLGINKKDADQASDLVKSLIVEVRLEVNQEALDIIKTQKWIEFCKKVSLEFKVFVRIEEEFGMWIAGIKENVANAQENIQKALEDIQIQDSGVKGEPAHVQHVPITLEDSVTQKRDANKVEQPDLHKLVTSEKESEKEKIVLIGGAKNGSPHSQKAKKVRQVGLHKSATGEKGEGLTGNTGHGYKVGLENEAETYPRIEARKQDNEKSLNANASNVSSNATSTPGYSGASSSVGATSVKCGNATISWKKGNIAEEHVCVQVGSTIGKLFDIFAKAGGPQFTEELKKLGRSSNPVIVSMPGNLPCNQVLLVSCFRWDGANCEAEKRLRSVLRECLQQALKLNATSIAFPIIGTGGLGFPYAQACQIMINEVINVTSVWKPVSLNDIRFVVFAQDAKLVNVFQQEFTSAFDKTSGPEPLRRGILSRVTRSLRKPSSRIPSTSKASVEVLQGDIIDETTDAIVNINAPNMDMQNAGALSKAVAAAAGPSVQTECTKLGKQTVGSAVITGAGKLKAKHIIHMIPGGASVQHIQKCIEECLQTAENLKLKSISLPACGTGGLKMSDADSAQATFQALAKVIPNFKHLKQVRIVIFQSQLLTAFKVRLWSMEMDNQLTETALK